MLILTACMLCGQCRALNPETVMTDKDWRYVFERGWLCLACQEVNSRRPPAGRPPKAKRQD